MTDQAASLVWDKVQWPFGETFSVSGASTNPKRFPGQLHDPETGFHYNYFRDYDPTTGRYLQSDPIGLDGGLNTYAYVGGSPVGLVDPKGESAEAPPQFPTSDSCPVQPMSCITAWNLCMASGTRPPHCARALAKCNTTGLPTIFGPGIVGQGG
jgi:RHS repeat-associated protein